MDNEPEQYIDQKVHQVSQLHQRVGECILQKRFSFYLSGFHGKQCSVHPSYDCTYIVFCREKHENWTVHLSGQGKIISRLEGLGNVSYMVSPFDIISTKWTYYTDIGIITHCNIPSKTVKSNQYTIYCEYCSTSCVIFEDSKLIALIESAGYAKISYYKFPFDQTFTPIKIFQVNQRWPKKIDDRSSIALLDMEYLHNSGNLKLKMTYYSCYNQTPLIYQFLFPHNEDFDGKYFYCDIQDFWEVYPGCLFIAFQSRVHPQAQQKLKGSEQLKLLKSKEIKQMYFWKFKQNLCYKPKFSFTNLHKSTIIQFTTGIRQPRANLIIKDPSDIYSYKRRPTYYVNPFTEQIVDIDISQQRIRNYNSDKYSYSFTIDGYLEVFTQTNNNWNDQKFVSLSLIQKKFVQFRYCLSTVASFFMINIVEEVDDDLLFEILTILHGPKEVKIQELFQGWQDTAGY